MLHSLKKISTLDAAIDAYFTSFKTKLVELNQSQWTSEDLRGKSSLQWTIMQYYNLMYLLILVHREVTRTADLGKDWAYFEGKYNLAAIKFCIACQGINYDKALEAFGFNNLIPGGIEDMQIESNFEIHGEDLPVSDVKIKDLIANPYICINYIKEVGVGELTSVNQTGYFDTIQDTIDNNDGQVEDSD